MSQDFFGAFIDRREMKVGTVDLSHPKNKSLKKEDVVAGSTVSVTYSTKDGDKTGRYPIHFVVDTKGSRYLVILGEKVAETGDTARW